MGEVYRAEDTKLGRQVAIKVLPEAVAGDPERLARFEREAKVLASLNHPNIAGIHQIEEAEGKFVLVMELAEGDDLSQRIAQGPIPLDEALPMARQIASALEAAHEAGIIHRDLKPANVKIDEDNQVKVLDFGLAKALESDPSSDSINLSMSPTLTSAGTMAGVILGTASYMSPEQARGKAVDRRADIWAFGCVIYEMLAGIRLFRGETVSDILAGVLKTDPTWEQLPVETPSPVRRLLARCLTRDPKDRLHDIADARLDLDEALDGEELESTLPAAVGAGDGSRRREVLAWLVAALALGTVGVLALRPTAPPHDTPLTRFDLTIPEGHRLAYVDLPILSLSPDGRSLAFVAVDTAMSTQRIYLRTLDDTANRPISGTEQASDPTFSPDGRNLAFFADGNLKRIPIDGGTATNLATTPNPRGVVWSPDDSIIYSPEYVSGLWRIPGGGGTPEILVEPDSEAGERTYRWPDVSPDGRIVVFTIGTTRNPNSYEDAQIAAFSLDTGKRIILLEEANMARFVGSDRLLIDRSGTLYLASFDAQSLEVVGQPLPVLEGIGGDPSSGAAYFALSSAGSLAFVPGAITRTQAFLNVVDREGNSTRLPLEPRPFHHPRFSPTEEKVAFTVGIGAAGASGDVWLFDLETEGLNRISFGDNSSYPSFSPDGHWVAYSSDTPEPAIYRKPVDGSGAAEQISPIGTDTAIAESWSPDGSMVAYVDIGATDVYLLRPGEEAELFEKDASSPVFSPDGRWIAYHQPGSGTSSVFVRPIDGDGKWQVSPGNGAYPRWRADSRQLFYIDIDTAGRPLMEVDIAPGDTFRTGPPKQLLADLASRFSTATSPAHNWDVSPDGNRFLFVENDRDESAYDRIELILNWARNLQATSH